MTNTTPLPDDLVDELLDEVLGTDSPEPGQHEPLQHPAPFIAAIPAEQMFADLDYQRPIDDARVRKMTSAYDVALVVIIEVAQRGPDSYAILDGQHRWAMCKRVLDNPTLVARIHRGLTVAEEAKLYHQLNTTRRALTTWDRWVARRTAGDPAVEAIEQILITRGLRVAHGVGPDRFRAVAAAERIVKLGGLALLADTIDLVRAAWPEDQTGLDANLIQGLALVLSLYPDELDRDRLLTTMAGYIPRQILARADAARELHTGTKERLVAHVLVANYNSTARAGRIDPFLNRLAAHSKHPNQPINQHTAAADQPVARGDGGDDQ